METSINGTMFTITSALSTSPACGKIEFDCPDIGRTVDLATHVTGEGLVIGTAKSLLTEVDAGGFTFAITAPSACNLEVVLRFFTQHNNK